MDDLLIETCFSLLFSNKRYVFLLTREIFLKNTQLGIIIRLEIELCSGKRERETLFLQQEMCFFVDTGDFLEECTVGDNY